MPTGPELITGSTRLKAGTATKVALNILSSCAMIRLGRVEGNSMVCLQPTNEKLRDRATQIVAERLGFRKYEAEKSPPMRDLGHPEGPFSPSSNVSRIDQSITP